MAAASALCIRPCGHAAAARPSPATHRPAVHTARLRVLRRATEGEQAAQAAPPLAAAEAPTPQAAVTSGSSTPPPPEGPSGSKGLLAGGAVGLGVALFLAGRLALGGPSFAALEADAVPLDQALANGRPSVVEFYAGREAGMVVKRGCNDEG